MDKKTCDKKNSSKNKFLSFTEKTKDKYTHYLILFKKKFIVQVTFNNYEKHFFFLYIGDDILQRKQLYKNKRNCTEATLIYL